MSTVLHSDAIIDAVDAELFYLVPGSRVNRRFVAPGAEINTGHYQPHRVKIRNARASPDRFTLDTHGFRLARYPSAVQDFTNQAQVDALYAREVEQIVRELTGADLVVPMGSMLRTASSIPAHGMQPPAADVHVDMTPEVAERAARTRYEQAVPNGPGYSRFIASSVWRCFSQPPQDWPLTVCDSRTVGADEGVPNLMILVDALPEGDARLVENPPGNVVAAASVFAFNPDHRWWYFSDMTRDEIIFIKFYDSDRSRAWRTPHTAFHDSGNPNAHTRESIEFRTMAYFL